MIENDRLLQYVGTGTDWEWSVVRGADPVINGSNYTWSFARTEIGAPLPEAFAFNANGYAPQDSQAESGALWRSIRVALRNPKPGWRIRARDGYTVR